mgnify:CR=1 FL=1
MAEHSRSQADFIADIVIQQPILIEELLNIVLLNKEPISRRASWPLRIISDRDINILGPYVHTIIKQLPKIHNVAISRAFLAILVNVNIPEEYCGELLQYTSEILINPGSPVASLIYSADIFYKLSIGEPELLNELKLMLELLIPFGSAGVKSKCRKTIKKIEKNNRYYR